jgi:hypothetical protein
MEQIQRRSFEEQDRAELQEVIARRVEQNPDAILQKYEQAPQSCNGRYICADLFKEQFPEYAQSKESRARYNAVVHNTAAVLAAEQLKRVISDPARQGDKVMFLTGVPGAGKTSSIVANGQIPTEFKAVYEGQLSRPEPAIPKIQTALDAGLKPVIVAVHTTPEQALESTFKRFEENGRGAGIKLMADIQGNLPTGLATIQEHFGKAVSLIVLDNTDRANPTQKHGWENISTLQREGNHEQIKQRLTNFLEHARRTGQISAGCYEQACGRAPGILSRNNNLVQ